MNKNQCVAKKANTNYMIMFVVGLILLIIIAIPMYGFIARLFNIFSDNPDQATIGSFDNLIEEIENIIKEDTNQKTIPYYIKPGIQLNKCSEEVLCLCEDENCETTIKESEVFQGFVFIIKDQIIFEKDEVKNIKLEKNANTISISWP